MWKTVVGLVVLLSLLDVSRGKEFKGNLDPLKKLNATQPNCDLQSYFSSADELESLKKDLKEFCPAALSKSKLSDELKEKSLVLCQLVLVQLNRTCAIGKDEKFSPIKYEVSVDKDKVCSKKSVLTANEYLFPLITVPTDNALQIDAKTLCKQIVDEGNTKLVRLVYQLHLQLSKIKPKKDLPASNTTPTTSNATAANVSSTTNATAINVSANATATNATANGTATIIETKLANVKKVLNETLTRNASEANATAAPPALNATLLPTGNVSNATTETVKLNATTPIAASNSTAAKTLDLKKDEKEKDKDKETKNVEQKPKTDDKNDDEDADEDEENPTETEKKPEPKPPVEEPTKKEEPKKPEDKAPTEDVDGPDEEDPKKPEDEKKNVPAPDKSEEKKPKEEKPKEDEDDAEEPKGKDEKNPEDYGDGDNVDKEPAGNEGEPPAVDEDADADAEDFPKEGGRVEEEIVETNEGIDDHVDQPHNNERNPHQPFHHHLQETDDADKSSSGSKHHKHDEVKPPAKASERKPSSSYDADQGSSGSFVTYFLLFTLFVVIGYLILHNKNKVLGLLIEGCRRNHSHGRRSGTNSGRYHRLSQSS